MPINRLNPNIRNRLLTMRLGSYLNENCSSNPIDRVDNTSGVFKNEYNGCLINFTNRRFARPFDGYVGNIRKFNYGKTWDNVPRFLDAGDEQSSAYIYNQILNPSSKIQELWNDEYRKTSEDYVDYTNKLFGSNSSWYNVLAGLVDGRGGSLYLGDNGVGVVSNFNIRNTLAGDIVGTVSGRETPRGKFALKSAAISMANSSIAKLQKNVVNTGLDWLRGKLSAWVFNEEDDTYGIFDKSITNVEGSVIDDILNTTGLANLANVGLNEIGNLLGDDFERKLYEKIYGTIPSSASIFDIDHTSDNGLLNIQPDLNSFLEYPPLDRFDRNNYYIFNGKIVSARTTKTRNDALIANTGKMTVKFISTNLTRNKFTPNYENNKLDKAGYNKGKSEKYLDYSEKINQHLKKNVGLINKETSAWLDRIDKNLENNRPSKEYLDRAYDGINNNTLLTNDTDIKSDVTMLSKTKRLFENGKINTLISSFYSNTDGRSDIQSAVTADFGISHGRNLLKLTPENNVNGLPYTDPYCRVWTWYKQYRRLGNLIRPFDEIQQGLLERSLGEGYADIRPGMDLLKKNSVLMDNGFVKISPFSMDESEKDVKRYMFSIENLAWKDVDLERNLCETQIGPNGGRIMWFPPYDIKFNENVSVNWNKNDFIGRGESVYTYTNTERTGTLSFKIITDHPSVINYWNGRKSGPTTGESENDENEQSLLRFFAGCDTLKVDKKEEVTKPKPPVATQTDEVPYIPEEKTTNEPEESIQKITETLFNVFFPNDYSGIDYLNSGDDFNSGVNYLYSGHGKFNDGRGYGYESDSNMTLSVVNNNDVIEAIDSDGYTLQPLTTETDFNIIKQTNQNIRKNKFGYFDSNGVKIDGTFIYNMTLTDEIKPTYEKQGVSEDGWTSNVDGRLPRYRYDRDLSYWDVKNYRLNASTSDGGKYSFREIYEFINSNSEEFIESLRDVKKIECLGLANIHGSSRDNNKLATNRATLIYKWLDDFCKRNSLNIEIVAEASKTFAPTDTDIVNYSSGEMAKKGRCVKINVIREVSTTVSQKDADIEGSYDIVLSEEDVNEIQRQEDSVSAPTRQKRGRYDEEKDFFYKLGSEGNLEEAEFIHNKVREKIKYFVPAFHSTTPEGFNARLTFLHQCTRQGPTHIEQKGESNMAGNLAFGRQPFCVLRLGDFYNTKILIQSMAIDFEPLLWDLNPEGIGVQPMIANINLNIVFIGGSDLSSPISRLQNAVTFNFYGNTTVYDDRSDNKITDIYGEEHANESREIGERNFEVGSDGLQTQNSKNKTDRELEELKRNGLYKPMYNPYTYDKEQL